MEFRERKTDNIKIWK